MTKITVLRKGNALFPAFNEDQEAIRKIPPGVEHRFEFRRYRNAAHHRKFFALLGVIAHYSTTYDTVDKALVGIKIAIGHVEWIRNPKGDELVPVPKSISFGAMDQTEFDGFYSRAIEATLTYFLPDFWGNEQALHSAVNEIACF